MRTTYSEFARQVWPARASEWDMKGETVGPLPPDDFTEAVVNAAVAQLPSEEEVMSSCEVSYALEMLSAPSLELASAMTTCPDLNEEVAAQQQAHLAEIADRFATATLAAGVAHFRKPLADLEFKSPNGRVSARTIRSLTQHYTKGLTLNVTGNGQLEAALSDMLDWLGQHPRPERWRLTQAIEDSLSGLE